MTIYLLSLLSILPAPAQAHPPALSVRVDASYGAPRIVVNGQPRRARMFWGAPGSGLMPVVGEQRVQFDFTPTESELRTATMHFRFGHVAGDVDIDDIQVEDLSGGRDPLPRQDFEAGATSFTGEWHVWPQDAQNTVGTVTVQPGSGTGGSSGLHIHIVLPPTGVWPDFHIYHEANMALVAGHKYRVSFWVRANPARDLNIGFYRPGVTYVHLGGPPGHFESQIRLAARSGVDFVSFEVPLPWPAPGEAADWSGVDSVCATVLRANPHALLIPRIPVYVPEWWKRAHPDELMRWEDGLHSGVASPSSTVYRRDACARLTALIAYLEARFGSHVAGYHPTGQNTGEWFYMDTWERALNGYSPCDLAAWRTWLRARYGTSAALKTAWSDATVELETAIVPAPAARHAAPAGVFRDPASERRLIDFAEFQQQSMADCVLEIAHAARKASAGRKLVLFFYGYLFEFGAIRTGPAISGHYALSRVLASPDIDVLCAPISYFDRGPDGSAPCMTAAESVALAGKMWLNEDDTRTHLTRETDFPGGEHVVKSLRETNGELARNVAQEATRNFATWWMDLMGSGWFDEPGMWREMERLRRADEWMLVHPRAFHPEVAAIIDEWSMLRVAEGGDLATRGCVYEARAALGRLGAPYGQYLLSDLLRGRVPGRLLVFDSPWVLSKEQRAKLREATRGKLAVWCYAPGLFDDNSTSLDAMRELTGFALQPATGGEAWATPTTAGRRLGLLTPFGVHARPTPLFHAADARPDEVLAVYSDGTSAVALRRTGRGESLFVGPPSLTPELMRLAARLAGVHLYTQQDCAVYANGGLIALHGTKNGVVNLDAGDVSALRDCLNGQIVAHGSRASIPLRTGETRVLLAEPKTQKRRPR